MFYKPFVFENQPMLKTLEKLALADVGSHIFDLARFFFGEPQSIYCQTTRVRPDIAGEDVALGSTLGASANVICTCDMSYSSRTEDEQFPQTLFYIEGTQGTVELAPDFWIRLTTDEGTFRPAPSPAALRLGRSRLRRGPLQHRAVQRRSAGRAARRSSRRRRPARTT